MATTTMQVSQVGGKVGSQVGRSPPRLEAREKVTGRAEYTHTMRLPGMLHGKIFRSTVAHGRIKSVDTSAAKKVPGVYRVVTSEDVRKVIPEPYYGPAFHDQPILAIDKVHYVGEPVAVVIAADPHIAEEAVQLIVADYEELPAIYDEVEAADNKTLVHEELRPAGTFFAALVSIDLIRPCATVLRKIFPCSMPGSRLVWVYSARPVTFSRASSRGSERPTWLPTLPPTWLTCIVVVAISGSLRCC